MDRHNISSMMFCSSIKCLQVRCHATWLQNWKMRCWQLTGTFEMLCCRRCWISRKNCHDRWNLDTPPPVGNQETIRKGTIHPHQNRKIPHTAFCGKGYAYSLLGWTRSRFGALIALGEHCDQCNLCKSKNLLHPAIESKLCGRLSAGVL